MRKYYSYLIIFIGLLLPTIITAIYSSRSEVSEIVLAQSDVVG